MQLVNARLDAHDDTISQVEAAALRERQNRLHGRLTHYTPTAADAIESFRAVDRVERPHLYRGGKEPPLPRWLLRR
jgi:hypothetical protein